MAQEKPVIRQKSAPQYFMIQKSEPRYDLIKHQLLDPSHCVVGSSNYFIQADQSNCSICRIRSANGTVLFYEILNHYREGITDSEIKEALSNPANACPLPGYYRVTPAIEEKLRGETIRGAAGSGITVSQPRAV